MTLRMLGAAALILLVSACGAEGDDVAIPSDGPSTTTRSPAASAKPTPSRRTVTTEPAAPTTRPAASVTPTKPPRTPVDEPSTVLPQRLQEYMLRIESIRADLTSDEDATIEHGRAVCAHRTDTYQQLLSRTRKEFTEAGHDPVTATQASGIYEVIRDTLCPE
jgi:hypothetical protein